LPPWVNGLTVHGSQILHSCGNLSTGNFKKLQNILPGKRLTRDQQKAEGASRRVAWRGGSRLGPSSLPGRLGGGDQRGGELSAEGKEVFDAVPVARERLGPVTAVHRPVRALVRLEQQRGRLGGSGTGRAGVDRRIWGLWSLAMHNNLAFLGVVKRSQHRLPGVGRVSFSAIFRPPLVQDRYETRTSRVLAATALEPSRPQLTPRRQEAKGQGGRGNDLLHNMTQQPKPLRLCADSIASPRVVGTLSSPRGARISVSGGVEGGAGWVVKPK
jgi:hypothetical protein